MFIINTILKLEIEVLSYFGTNLRKKFHFRKLSMIFISLEQIYLRHVMSGFAL